MVCPICIGNGIFITIAEILGIPTPVTYTALGLMDAFISLSIYKWLKNKGYNYKLWVITSIIFGTNIAYYWITGII